MWNEMINIKYINDAWVLDDYFKYLKTIENKVDKALYNFIGDTNRYHINHQDSLHDSWLKSVQIKFIEKQVESISIKFLGPYHDKEYTFIFKNIINYKFDSKLKIHGDLLTHEFHINNKKNYEYRFLFDKNTRYYICCKEIQVKVKNILSS
jgi:hypothetical protein